MSKRIKNPRDYWNLNTRDTPHLKEACKSKNAYSSERMARQVGRNRLREGGRKPATRLWCYACACCRDWHLTSVEAKGAAITADEMWEGTGL